LIISGDFTSASLSRSRNPGYAFALGRRQLWRPQSAAASATIPSAVISELAAVFCHSSAIQRLGLAVVVIQ